MKLIKQVLSFYEIEMGFKAYTLKTRIFLSIHFFTRAVIWKIFTDLTEEAFIASFHKFYDIRGNPLGVYSGKSRNFTRVKR